MNADKYFTGLSFLLVTLFLVFVAVLVWWIVTNIRKSNKKSLALKLTGLFAVLTIMCFAIMYASFKTYNDDTVLWRSQYNHINQVSKDEHLIVKALKEKTDLSTYNGYKASKDLVKQAKSLPDEYATENVVSNAKSLEKIMHDSRTDKYVDLDEWAHYNANLSILDYFVFINGSFSESYTHANKPTKDSKNVSRTMISNADARALGSAIKQARDYEDNDY